MKKFLFIASIILLVYLFSGCSNSTNTENVNIYNLENSVHIQHIYSKLQSEYNLGDFDENCIDLTINKENNYTTLESWLVFDTSDWETVFDGLKYAIKELAPLTNAKYISCTCAIWIKYDEGYVVHSIPYTYYKNAPGDFYLSQTEFNNPILERGFDYISSNYKIGSYSHNTNAPDFIHPMLEITFQDPYEGFHAEAEFDFKEDYSNDQLIEIGECIQQLLKDAVNENRKHVHTDYYIQLNCPSYTVIGKTKNNSDVVVWEKREN